MQLEVGKKYNWLDGLEVWEYVGETTNGKVVFRTDTENDWEPVYPEFDKLKTLESFPTNCFPFFKWALEDLNLTPYEDTDNPSS